MKTMTGRRHSQPVLQDLCPFGRQEHDDTLADNAEPVLNPALLSFDLGAIERRMLARMERQRLGWRYYFTKLLPKHKRFALAYGAKLW